MPSLEILHLWKLFTDWSFSNGLWKLWVAPFRSQLRPSSSLLSTLSQLWVVHSSFFIQHYYCRANYSFNFLKKPVHIHVLLFAYLSCTESREATLATKQMHRRWHLSVRLVHKLLLSNLGITSYVDTTFWSN